MLPCRLPWLLLLILLLLLALLLPLLLLCHLFCLLLLTNRLLLLLLLRPFSLLLLQPQAAVRAHQHAAVTQLPAVEGSLPLWQGWARRCRVAARSGSLDCRSLPSTALGAC